ARKSRKSRKLSQHYPESRPQMGAYARLTVGAALRLHYALLVLRDLWLYLYLGGQGGQAGDVPVAFGSRAVAVRVEVDRLQAGGDGAGHVVPAAVADVQDGVARGHAERVQRDAADGGVRLGDADHRGVDECAHRGAR